jgi:hypothetical protein
MAKRHRAPKKAPPKRGKITCVSETRSTVAERVDKMRGKFATLCCDRRWPPRSDVVGPKSDLSIEDWD